MKLKRKLQILTRYILPYPFRTVNLLLIKISKKFKKHSILSYPSTLMIEPTNICNLKCPLCPTGAGLIKREKGFLSFQNFKKVIDEGSRYAFHLRLWNWGEPLLNKDLFKIISYAKTKKIFVNMSTNSSFLDEEISKKIINSQLDELIISLDGASKETYLKYRKGGDFEKIIRALEFLTKEKKRLHTQFPYVKLQFIIMRHNEHEISKIKELAGKLGVDELCFKTVGIMDYSSKEDIKKYLPLNKNYSRYTLEEDKIVSKKEIPNNCDFIWEEMIINWDGSVVPCCFDMNNSHPLGNAFQEGVKMVWKSKEFNSFRKLILTDKKRIPLCKYCPGTNKETFLEV